METSGIFFNFFLTFHKGLLRLYTRNTCLNVVGSEEQYHRKLIWQCLQWQSQHTVTLATKTAAFLLLFCLSSYKKSALMNTLQWGSSDIATSLQLPLVEEGVCRRVLIHGKWQCYFAVQFTYFCRQCWMVKQLPETRKLEYNTEHWNLTLRPCL